MKMRKPLTCALAGLAAVLIFPCIATPQAEQTRGFAFR